VCLCPVSDNVQHSVQRNDYGGNRRRQILIDLPAAGQRTDLAEGVDRDHRARNLCCRDRCLCSSDVQRSALRSSCRR